eukprot:1871517-Rhodomonas_salina.1
MFPAKQPVLAAVLVDVEERHGLCSCLQDPHRRDDPTCDMSEPQRERVSQGREEVTSSVVVKKRKRGSKV